jgi:hypothetical protein
MSHDDATDYPSKNQLGQAFAISLCVNILLVGLIMGILIG